MEINYILIIVALVILLALFLKVFLAYWAIKNKLQKSTQTRYIYVEVPIETLKVARNFGDYQKVFYEPLQRYHVAPYYYIVEVKYVNYHPNYLL